MRATFFCSPITVRLSLYFNLIMIRFLSSLAVPAFLNFQSCGLALLLVYICTFTLTPGLSPHHVHDHHDHGETVEHDPCHIRIFHPWAEGGCDHKFHFTAYCEDCQDQQVMLLRQIVPTSI